jgi:NADH-quinone oxidoreductase subunit J
MAITNRNAIHGLLYLILCFLQFPIFYISGAPLLLTLEVIVYAGAIMVLFIFVVMMLNIGIEEELENKRLRLTKWIIPVILAVILLVIFVVSIRGLNTGDSKREVISPKQVGISLFTTYLIGVEIAAILLLVEVGAYHLGKQKKKVIHRFLNFPAKSQETAANKSK